MRREMRAMLAWYQIHSLRRGRYNDATVLEVARSEELGGFQELFSEIMLARYATELPDDAFSGSFRREEVAGFLGQAVLGNMRAFVFACNLLSEQRGTGTIGLTILNQTLLELARNHYWPLLEELTPKLGVYEPLVAPARVIAELMFEKCGKADGSRYAIVYRDITERLSKPFEILEYSGFIAKRDVSRAMKSGGRGSRFAINLCNLLENVGGTRLTDKLFRHWSTERSDPIEFHRGSDLAQIEMPRLKEVDELEILRKPVDILAKSDAYPYGLTEAKIQVLQDASINTVGELASASDEVLLKLSYVGPAFLRRFRNVVGQAIWM